MNRRQFSLLEEMWLEGNEKLWGAIVSVILLANQVKYIDLSENQHNWIISKYVFLFLLTSLVCSCCLNSHQDLLVIWNANFLLLKLTFSEVICAFVRMHQGLQTQYVYYRVYKHSNNSGVRVRICSCTYSLPGIPFESPRTCFLTSWWR